jgi:hypothetical protein
MAAKNESTAVLLAWSKMVPISQAQDPLGLSLRVSARLSSELLHCITSITPRARYFSFLPWCVADFEKHEKASRVDADLIEAVRLREKALTLGCVLHHNGDACKDGRLVGSEKAMEWLAANPDRSPKFSQLSFVKNPALDAYYNSLVHLGFFNETPDENWVKEEAAETEDGAGQEITDLELSELGNRVASSYERAIGHLPVVAKLTREPDGCKPGELKKWGEFGGLCELADSSAPDRALLREIFFDRVGSPGQSHKFRHDSLMLFMELIDKISPHGIGLDHFVLRDVVYFNATSNDDDGNEVLNLEISRPLEDIANRWRMFYFHYFLSVALESLFVGVVGYAQKAGMAGTRLETIVDSLKSKSVLKFVGKVLGGKIEGNFLEMTPRQLFKAGGFKSAGEDLGAGDNFDRHFNYSHPLSENNLAGQLRRDDLAYASPEGIACALVLLTMTVSRYTRWDGEQYGNWLAGATHDPFRDITVPVVLRELRESSNNFLDATWREIAMLVIGRFVVRQHEVLSYEKVWDGTRALFHSEQGVIRWRGLSYDDIVVENSRFYSAVQILEDLALVEHDNNDRWQVKLTAEGGKFLKGELARMEKK